MALLGFVGHWFKRAFALLLLVFDIDFVAVVPRAFPFGLVIDFGLCFITIFVQLRHESAAFRDLINLLGCFQFPKPLLGPMLGQTIQSLGDRCTNFGFVLDNWLVWVRLIMLV